MTSSCLTWWRLIPLFRLTCCCRSEANGSTTAKESCRGRGSGPGILHLRGRHVLVPQDSDACETPVNFPALLARSRGASFTSNRCSAESSLVPVHERAAVFRGQQGREVRAFGGGADSVSRWMAGSCRPVAHLGCLRCGCARRPGQGEPITVFCSSPWLPLDTFGFALLSKLESREHPFLGFGRVLENETRPSRRVENRGRSRSLFPGGEQSTGKKGWYFDSYLSAGLCGGYE